MTYSIKNPNIKHAVEERKNSSTVTGKSTVYLCNQAVNATLEKIATDNNEVTCKNCLKKLGKSKPGKEIFNSHYYKGDLSEREEGGHKATLYFLTHEDYNDFLNWWVLGRLKKKEGN